MIQGLATGHTVREVIQEFRDLAGDKTGKLSDDNPWSNRLVLKYLMEYRSRILGEKQRERGRDLSRQTLQTIPCVTLVEVDKHECPCAPPTGCSFLKTKDPIPKPIGDYVTVSSIHGEINYSFVEWNKLHYKLNSRVPSQRNAAYYTIKNVGDGNHVYLLNDEHKKYLTITSMFYNPLEVQYFPDCTGNVDWCKKPMDQEFIIDPDLLSTTLELVIDRLLTTRSAIGADVINNDHDDTSGVKVPNK